MVEWSGQTVLESEKMYLAVCSMGFLVSGTNRHIIKSRLKAGSESAQLFIPYFRVAWANGEDMVGVFGDGTSKPTYL